MLQMSPESLADKMLHGALSTHISDLALFVLGPKCSPCGAPLRGPRFEVFTPASHAQLRPLPSSRPSARFRFCTAAPLAPFPRLSSLAATTHVRRSSLQ